MLYSSIKTEATPERVYELCKLVSIKNYTENEARNMMEPQGINKQPYFPMYREVASELGLICKTGDVLEFIGDKKDIKDIDSFRKYCNSILYKDTGTRFYKILKAVVLSDVDLIGETMTSNNNKKIIQLKSGLTNIDDKELQGIRFWLSFLGFGYIQESGNSNYMFYLPNMYVALKDFCILSELEKNKTYMVSEFFRIIYDMAHIVIEDIKDDRHINLALSNALRLMHDNGEIELNRASDGKEIWYLYKDTSHSIESEFTHIKYKGRK